MDMMHSSEIYLRSAVFTAQKNLEKGENLAEKIKNQALNQLSLVQKAEGLFAGTKNSENLQAAAIHIAVQGIELAYVAINSELSQAKFKRKRFVEECESHLASFTLSTQRELNEYSLEELAIHEFIQMIDMHFVDIKPYFGIQVHRSNEFPEERFYSVIPFYRMSMSLQQNNIIASKIDTHRQGIFLFLKTGLPLQYYYEKYKEYSRLWLQIQGLTHTSNYLNHLKAPRFIISALANLLWNLQHPVDCETGIPLPIDECIMICNKASMFLNDLLNPSQFKHLPNLDKRCKKVIRSLCKIELLLKSLQSAFEYDHLHEINLTDISKHMHSALRIMSNRIMELIYREQNAAEKLVGQIMMMGELLMHNYELYEIFHALQVDCKPKFINEKARTLIDVITLFAHQTPKKRKQIWQSLINTDSEYHIQFGHQLKEFHKNFLLHFEDIVMKNLKLKTFNKNMASHFIPLILMVMESFTVFRDTRPKKLNEINPTNEPPESLYDLQNTTHDRKQRHLILNDAATLATGQYYRWSLSSFINVKSSFHESLDMLLSKQNEMRINTLELDTLAFKLSENRTLLLKKAFKEELLLTLTQICNFYTELLKMFNDIESHMQADLKLQRDQKRILQPMLDDLEATMIAIQKSITMVRTIITASEFEEQELMRRQEKIGISFAPYSSPSKEDSAKETLLGENYSPRSFFKNPPSTKKDCFQPKLTQQKNVPVYVWPLNLIGCVFVLNIIYPFMLFNTWLSFTLALLCFTLPVAWWMNTSFNLPENFNFLKP